MNCKIAVIGGGISGLSVSLFLSKQYNNITIYNSAPECGGRLRSIKKFPINLQQPKNLNLPRYLDNGPHLFLGAYKNFFKLLQLAELDINKIFYVQPFSWYSKNININISDGNFISALGKSIIKSKGLSIIGKLEFLKLITKLSNPNLEKLRSISVEQWVTNLKINQTLQNQFFMPLCLSALNTPAAFASAACFANIINITFFSGSSRNWSMFIPYSDFSSSIINPLINKLLNSPTNSIINNTRIKKIIKSKKNFTLIDNHQKKHTCDKLVIATNPGQALKLLNESKTTINSQIQIQQLKKIIPSPITSVYGMAKSKTNLQLANNLPLIQHQYFQGHDIVWINFLKFRTGTSKEIIQPQICAIYSSVALTDPDSFTNMAMIELNQQFKFFNIPQFDWFAITEKQATIQSNLTRENINPIIDENLYLCGDYLSDLLPSTVESASQSASTVNELI